MASRGEDRPYLGDFDNRRPGQPSPRDRLARDRGAGSADVLSGIAADPAEVEGEKADPRGMALHWPAGFAEERNEPGRDPPGKRDAEHRLRGLGESGSNCRAGCWAPPAYRVLSWAIWRQANFGARPDGADAACCGSSGPRIRAVAYFLAWRRDAEG